MSVFRKAKRLGALFASAQRPGVVEEPGMCVRFLCGNREISRSTNSRGEEVREVMKSMLALLGRATLARSEIPGPRGVRTAQELTYSCPMHFSAELQQWRIM